ncbi:MAG: hypothetical protein CMO74_08015, partial [Verrucomicrobiales bacterium]|nr:hypothetical protein [Verrucomicrobiales bacterium]
DPGSKKSNQSEVSSENSSGVFAGDGTVSEGAQSYIVHLGGSTAGGSNSIIGSTKNILTLGCRGDYNNHGGGGNSFRAWDPDGTALNNNKNEQHVEFRGIIRNGKNIEYESPMTEGRRFGKYVAYMMTGNTGRAGNGRNNSRDNGILANAWLGPDIKADARGKWGENGDRQMNMNRNIILQGLSANQGQVAKADGAVLLANDKQLQDAIKSHATADTTSAYAREAVLHPVRNK